MEKIRYWSAVAILAILMMTTAGPALGAVGSHNAMISFGYMGDDVSRLQKDLQQLGYNLKPENGVYGVKTYDSVRDFQQKHRLNPNGIADRRTIDEIRKALEEKNRQRKPVLSKHNYSNKDVELLARAVNGEARGESLEGQVAVAAVIINRTKSPEFPKSVQEVVFQSGAFDAVDDGQVWLEPEKSAYKAAELALQGHDPTGDALYYYNPAKTTNKWIWSRPVITKIGRHVFAK